ncbi:hypothetical protein SGPA1_12262 [Streptomyces misionensis JCM 4497]
MRGRRGVLAGHHRLHGDGRPDLAHVHHRPGRHQDRHRRGRRLRGAGRRPHPQRRLRRGPPHGRGREGRRRVHQAAAVLPAVQQPLRAPGVPGGGGPLPDRRGPRAGHPRPGQRQPAVRHPHGGRTRRGRRRVLRDAGPVRAEHRHRLRPGRGPPGGRRRQPADAVRGLPRHRRLREGRPLRAHLRRLQRPGADLRGRARLPARRRPGARGHHPARRQADLRLRRGHRPADHRDHPQGLRRRLRRHGLQAPGRRPQPGLADRPDRRHGRPGRGQHPAPAHPRRGGGERRGRGGRAGPADPGVRGHPPQPLRGGRARLCRRGDHAVRHPRPHRPGPASAAHQAGITAPEEARQHPPLGPPTDRSRHDDQGRTRQPDPRGAGRRPGGGPGPRRGGSGGAVRRAGAAGRVGGPVADRRRAGAPAGPGVLDPHLLAWLGRTPGGLPTGHDGGADLSTGTQAAPAGRAARWGHVVVGPGRRASERAARRAGHAAAARRPDGRRRHPGDDRGRPAVALGCPCRTLAG